MTWVKVCGLTRQEEVAAAVAAGADAVGFVTYPGSPRYCSVDAITGLAAGVPITTVMLTVDLGVAVALEALEAAGVTGIQPYGPEAPGIAAAAHEAGYLVLYPVRAGEPLPRTEHGVPLVDTADDSLLGGTGRTFDWGLVREVEGDFVLAGGLGPDNVVDAIRAVRPWGVDASSGLEQAPGRKDAGKVIDFVRKAKQA